jgi:hypothetical protein
MNISEIRTKIQTFSEFDDEIEINIDTLHNHYLFMLSSYRRSQVAFLYAVLGLLAYGNIHYVDDFIDNLLPLPRDMEGYIPRLVNEIFIHLFPLPDELADYLYLRQHPEKYRTWFRANRKSLVWDEGIGKYVFINKK